jgi:hypothetical protein
MKAKKKGLFLSIELIVVIVIITAIVSMAAAGVVYLLNAKRINGIVTEANKIKEATIEFKITHGAYPGLISSPTAGGTLNGVFNNTGLNADYTKLNAEVSTKKITGPISEALVWRELYLHAPQAPTSTISTADSSTKYTAAAGACQGYAKAIDAQFAPTTSFDQALAWVVISTKDDTTKSGIVAQADVSKQWPDTKPRLMLVRYSGAQTGCLDLSTQELGAISANTAYDIAQKLNSTMPYTGNSVLFDNVKTSTGCVAGTISSYSTAKFAASDDDSGANGCVATFRVD